MNKNKRKIEEIYQNHVIIIIDTDLKNFNLDKNYKELVKSSFTEIKKNFKLNKKEIIILNYYNILNKFEFIEGNIFAVPTFIITENKKIKKIIVGTKGKYYFFDKLEELGTFINLLEKNAKILEKNFLKKDKK